MPTYYTTELKLKGSKEALAAFMDKHVVPNHQGDLCLEFNTIIPMPEIFKTSEISTFGYSVDPTKSRLAREEIGSRLWRIGNWGTEWNSRWLEIVGSVSRKQIKLTFDTAWSAPIPVIRKLTQLHPDLAFSVRGRPGGYRWASEDVHSPDWEGIASFQISCLLRFDVQLKPIKSLTVPAS